MDIIDWRSEEPIIGAVIRATADEVKETKTRSMMEGVPE